MLSTEIILLRPLVVKLYKSIKYYFIISSTEIIKMKNIFLKSDKHTILRHNIEYFIKLRS